MAKYQEPTDPYGYLEYAVGSGDDFHCFDFCVHNDGTVTLHAVINSETGSFIMNADDPVRVKAEDAVRVAQDMVWAALEWCTENEVRLTMAGWAQDPAYFVRSVKYAINPVGKAPARRRKNWRNDLL